MNAARVPGAFQPQLARGVVGQKPLGQNAVFHDVTTLRAHAFAVERRGGQAFQQVRMLFDGEPFRQDLLAQRVEQEGRFTVNGAARDSAHQMAKQTGRHFVGKNHRGFHGGELARRQARQRAFGARFTHPLRRLQIPQRAANGIGVVALHVTVLFGDDAAGERVAGRAVALQHAVTVAEDFDAVVAVKAAAFGIGDALVGLQGRLLGAGSQLNRFVRRHFRRMEQVEIRRVKRQQIFIRHAGVRIR